MEAVREKEDRDGLPVPNEITAMILDNLDWVDVVAAIWVSRQWRQVLTTGRWRDRRAKWTHYNARTYMAELAARGHLEVLRWARKNKYPWDDRVCTEAARRGHLEVLKWARAERCLCSTRTTLAAASHGQLEALKLLRAGGCPWFKETCWRSAIAFGHREVEEWITSQNE
nr:ankyrin repeat [Pandoravirus massiliensis]